MISGKDSRYLTFISVVSAFSVLTLHTNGCFWTFNATAPYWKSANIIECVFYFAVPLFFMLSGITLMDFYERYSLRNYFIKRFQKTFIPFLFWSLIGFIWKFSTNRLNLHEYTSKDLPYILYQGITGTTFVDIFWFFTSLFTIYLSLPLFAAVEKSKRKSVFTYLTCAGFILNILLPFLKKVFSSTLNIPYSVTVVSGYLIWAPLGWLLHNCELKTHHKTIVYILAIIGLLLHLAGTYILSIEAGRIVQTYKGYQNVPCVLYSVGVFVFLKDIGRRIMDLKIGRFIMWLGSYTLPIYLMQFILLDLGKRFFDTTSILYRLGAPFIMIAIMITVTSILRKIPLLRHVVP